MILSLIHLSFLEAEMILVHALDYILWSKDGGVQKRNLKSKGHNANLGGKITSILLLATAVLGSRSLTFVVIK